MALLLLLALSVITIVLILGSPRDFDGDRRLLTARNIVLMLILMYYAFPAVLILQNSGRYTWAVGFDTPGAMERTLILALVGTISFAFGSWLAGIDRSRRHLRELSQPTAELAPFHVPRVASTAAWTMVGVGLSLKIYLIASSGGWTDTLLRLSGYARESSGVAALVSASLMVRAMSSMAELGAAWLILEALRTARPLRIPAIAMALSIVLSFSSTGKRLVLLLPLFAIALGFSQFRHKIKSRQLPMAMLGAVLVGMGSLLFRVLAPASAAGYTLRLQDVSYARGSWVNFYLYSLEFSTFEMTTVADRRGPALADMFGGTASAFYVSNIEPFLYLVPRAIFPWKPDQFYDLSYGVSAILSSQSLDGVGAGYATTIMGSSLIVGGLVGLVVAIFLLGFACRRIDRHFDRPHLSTTHILTYAVLLNFVFHLFRQGTLGWAFIVGVVQQIGFIGGLILLAYLSLSRVEEAKPSSPQRVGS